MIDRYGTLIQATGFNETATNLSEILEQDSVYTICNGQVKLANKQFTSMKNDFSLTLDNTTVFEKCPDDPFIEHDGFTFTFLKGIAKIT